VKPALLKMSSTTISVMRKATKESPIPMIWCDSHSKYIMPCFGCKTAKWNHNREHLPSECKDAEQHLCTLKKLLEVPEKVEEVVDTDELAKLKQKMVKLKEFYDSIEETLMVADELSQLVLGKDCVDIENGAKKRNITVLEYLKEMGVKPVLQEDDRDDFDDY